MAKKDDNSLTLKVREALPKDVGRVIARIDPEDLKVLGLEVGEIVEIEGKRKTAGTRGVRTSNPSSLKRPSIAA